MKAYRLRYLTDSCLAVARVMVAKQTDAGIFPREGPLVQWTINVLV